MIQETVFIKTEEGHQLTGILRIPDQEGTYPAVLICHGFLANKDRELIFDIGNGVSLSRMITLRFDFSAHGESEGIPKHKTVSRQAKDIKAAIDFLESIHQVDKEKIAIIGHELGGMAAFIANDPRIKAYALINMRADTKGFINSYFSEAEIKEWEATKVYDSHEIYELPVDFLHDMRKHDITDATIKIVRPLLIIQGTNDKRTPFENARALFYNAKMPTLEMVEGADHNFTDQKQRQYIIGFMTNWLLQVLR